MNLLIIYAIIFLIIFVILGIKLGFKKASYLKSMGIVFIIIVIGITTGIFPTKVGECGDDAIYIHNIYKTTKIYGKGIIGGVPRNTKNIIIASGSEEIGYGAFWDCKNLEYIEIPETIEKIGDRAFYNCSSISKIQLPSNLKFIGESAFWGCENLESIEIPETVEQICIDAFRGTNISKIYLPDNTLINQERFSNGKYYDSYANKTFHYCRNLREVNVSEKNNNYIEVDGVIFNKNKTEIVCYPQQREGDIYIIPDSVKSLNSFSIAFANNIKEITIGKNVETMHSNAIFECENLEKIKIEDGVKEIRGDAISECYKLSDIYIPNSVTAISGRIKSSATIHCSEDSYAHDYAKTLGYNYVINED